jgi:tetratricopeptide (TPR) repeat protein
MQRILFVGFLLLSLMVCLTSAGCLGGMDDVKAGIAAATGGNYDEAIRLYTKAIASGKLSGENLSKVYDNRGDAWVKKGDDDKAIADYTKALEIEPNQRNAVSYHSHGMSWFAKGDDDKAIAYFTTVIEMGPKQTETYYGDIRAKAYYSRGSVWYHKVNYDKAIADYTKAIEINPQYDDAYYSRGIAWGRKGDYDKAIADYTKDIELDPQGAAAYVNRGIAWDGKGDYDKAAADYTKAAEIATEEHQIAIAIAGPNYDKLNFRIRVVRIVGKYAKAFLIGESHVSENEFAYLEKRGNDWIVLDQGTAVDARNLNIPKEIWDKF